MTEYLQFRSLFLFASSFLLATVAWCCVAEATPIGEPSQTGASSEVAPGAVEDQTRIDFANWGYNPSASAHLELVEMERKNIKGHTEVIYKLEISGFLAGKTYMLWTMQSGDHKAFPIEGPYSLDAAGKLACQAPLQSGRRASARSRCVSLDNVFLNINNYHKGEPADYVVVSTDGMVRAYARAYPFPIQAQDGKCALTVELENTKFTSYVIRGAGFEPGENVKTSSNFGNGAAAGAEQASARGEFAAAIHADLPGKNSGSATFAAAGNSCNPTVTYQWGKAGMKVQ